MFCAALYDEWKNAEGEVVRTYTLITTAASEAFQWLHHRLPAILDPEDLETWLFSDDPKIYMGLLKPYTGTNLKWHPVTSKGTHSQYITTCMLTHIILNRIFF